MAGPRGIPRLTIALQPSRWLAVILVLAHGLALLAIAAAGVSVAWLGCASAALIGHGVWAVRCHALRNMRGAVTLVDLTGDTDCLIKRHGGETQSGKILATSLVVPWFVVMHVALTGRRFGASVLVLPDSVSPEVFRSLRMRLRWARYEGGRGL